MRRINPADLSTFLAIAKHGSFRRAAEELRVTPSALSHALRTLEERIDVRLFNRTSRSVALTQAGGKLLARIQPAFREIDEAIDDLDGFRGTPMGTLRINSGHTSAQLLLVPLISRFLKHHPAVSVELVTQSALVDIVSLGFDAGVRFGELVAADMIAVPLGPPQRAAIVATPAFFDRWPKPASPRELAKLPCVRLWHDLDREYRWEFERGAEKLEIAVDGPFTVSSQDLMLQAALSDVGLAYLFEEYARQHLEAGNLVRVLEDWCPTIPGFYLYYPSGRQMPPALRAFIDFFRDEP